ncbi:T9SS type A sorting domain-containing protein [Dysgonomonas sp. 520]|uniref:T9SS type A sorting domain-containing protein n=1 Tax=Dysgonomonas sp. 520 TaxID=2302931 RepID=UPI0013D40C12|nr:T9SS type A sorting domain-containing protein [Dysgonomonas sp. 520]
MYEAFKGGQQFVYGLSGDTIMNELTYQKLYLLNDTTLNIDRGDVFVAGIRQVDKKVLVQPADKKDGSKFEEFLMYDFSKNVGDTIYFDNRPYMGYGNFCSTFECVDKNDIRGMVGILMSIFENVYDIAPWTGSGDLWMPMIGSIRGGLFFSYRGFFSGPGGSEGCELICMKEKNNVKYMKEGCTSCFETPTASIENNNIENQLKVAYKQKDKIIKIIFSEFVPGLDFVLFTANGEVVNTFALADSLTNINVHSLSAGLYLYKIAGKNRYQSGKLIID